MFAILWTGAFLSNIGTWMETVGVGILVTEATGEALWTGLVAAAERGARSGRWCARRPAAPAPPAPDHDEHPDSARRRADAARRLGQAGAGDRDPHRLRRGVHPGDRLPRVPGRP